MKITREEFKELVALYKDVDSKANEYAKVLNDTVLDNLYFNTFDWIAQKLGLDEVFHEVCRNGYIIAYFDCIDDENFTVKPVYITDLDEIYDWLFNEREE